MRLRHSIEATFLTTEDYAAIGRFIVQASVHNKNQPIVLERTGSGILAMDMETYEKEMGR